MKIYNNQLDDGGIQGANIFNYIGLGYKELNILDESEYIFKKGIEYYSNFHDLYYNLSSIFLLKKNKKKAIEMLEHAKRISGDIIEGEKVNNKIQLSKPIETISIPKEKTNEIIDVLIHELLRFYTVCKDCTHINFFLASLFNQKKQHYNSLVSSMREQYINSSDASGFASFSSALSELSIGKLSQIDKIELVCMEKIKKALSAELSKIKEKVHGKEFSDNFMLLLTLISFFKVMAEEINEVLSYKALSLDVHELIKSKNIWYKINLNYEFIDNLKNSDEVFEIYKENKHIYELADFIEYNVPLLKEI